MINRRIVDIFMIAMVSFAAYLFYLNGKFIWDDKNLVVENHSIKSFNHIGSMLTQNDIGSGSGSVYNFYRPLQMVSYAWDYFCWKLNPAGYHITNIFLHIAVASMIYLFVSILYANRLLALLVSLLFALHPVHSETVAYISSRADLLFVFFTMSCCLAYFYYFKNGKSGYAVLSFLAYFLALFSKESAIIAIPLLLWTAYCFGRRVKAEHIVYFVLITLGYLTLRFTVSGAFTVLNDTTLAGRMPGVFTAIFEYWRILFLPFNLHMEYGRKPLHFYDCSVIVGIVFVVILMIYIMQRRNREKIALFPLGWFFIAIFPVLNIYPVNAYMAEHWLYLPSLGFFVMFAQWLTNNKNVITRNCFIAAIMLFYIVLHINHSSYWYDPVSFYKQTIGYEPKDARIHFYLGREYEAAGNYMQAIDEYQAAITLKRNYKECFLNLANVYAKQKRYADGEALYKRIIVDNPYYSEAYINLAILNTMLGNNLKAIELFQYALALGADDPAAIYCNLSRLYALAGNHFMSVRYHNMAGQSGQ